MFIKSLTALFLLTTFFCLPSSASDDRMIFFSFGSGGMSRYSCWSFTVEKKEGETWLNVSMTDENGDTAFRCRADDSLLSEIDEIAEKHRIVRWNGFNKKSKHALDGDSFGLSVKYTSGKTISARGYISAPNGYNQFKSDLIKIRDEAVKKYKPRGSGDKPAN